MAPLDVSTPEGPASGVDLAGDVVALTQRICDIPSVSGAEDALADAVEQALRRYPHLQVTRSGNAVVAATQTGASQRVILAGHLDTVPISAEPNLPTRLSEGVLWGRGSVDMKGGVAVALRLAAQLDRPAQDVTYVFYDNEEVESSRNGLGRLARTHPELLEGDFAVLLEPTNAIIEGGCKGTLRVEVVARGVAAHSARPWAGQNAIHAASRTLEVLTTYPARTVDVDGLAYHEALQAVGIRGGVAGNVIPDECVVTVNYRFAPDRDEQAAVAHVADLFAGFEVRVVDLAGGARPGLDRPVAQDFVAALGLPVTAKEGWTDVARFAGLGIPAVNFGPGDPMLAHRDDEQCPTEQILAVEEALLRWLAPRTR